jgi:hypothetical protein
MTKLPTSFGVGKVRAHRRGPRRCASSSRPPWRGGRPSSLSGGGWIGRAAPRRHKFQAGSCHYSLKARVNARPGRSLAPGRVIDAIAPCVAFIDAVEKALAGVGSIGDSGVSSRLFGTFLTWLSDHESEVFAVCTGNDISKLAPEFSRADRFDGAFFLDLPTQAERQGIWAIYRRQLGVPTSEPQPDNTDWTGAEIRACCRLAALLGVPLAQAARNVVPVSVTAAEQAERLTTARGSASPSPGRRSAAARRPPVSVAPPNWATTRRAWRSAAWASSACSVARAAGNGAPRASARRPSGAVAFESAGGGQRRPGPRGVRRPVAGGVVAEARVAVAVAVARVRVEGRAWQPRPRPTLEPPRHFTRTPHREISGLTCQPISSPSPRL